MRSPANPPAVQPAAASEYPHDGGKSRSARRRPGAIAGGVFALAALAVLAGEWAGWPFLREPLATVASRHTGVAIQVGTPFKVRFLVRPGVQAGRLHVGAAHGVDVPHLLDGKGLAARWRVPDAIDFARGGPLVLRSLTATELDAQLVREMDGRASWDWSPSEGQSSRRAVPRVEHLAIESGRIVWRDPAQRTDLKASFGGRAGGASADGAARSLADGSRAAGYSVTIDGEWQDRPLALRAWSATPLPLLALQPDGQPVPLRVEGRIGAATLHFDGRAQALLGARDLAGALRLAGPSLAAIGDVLGVTLPRTPRFSLRGALSHDDGRWALKVDRADIGSSRLGGDFRVDARRSPKHLEGRLTGSRLVLADLAPSVGAGGGASRPGRAAGRVLPAQPLDLPSLHAMTADVDVAIESLDFGTSVLRDMRGLRTALTLRNGVLSLDDLSAEVAGGSLGGRMALDGRDTPAKWTAQLKLANVDVVEWITALKKAPPAAAVSAQGRAAEASLAERGIAAGARAVTAPSAARYYVTGKLSAEVDTVGRGRSTAEILGNLDGRVSARLRDGTLSHLVTEVVGLDIAQSLGVAIRGDRLLPLRCARVDFLARGGVLEVKRAVMDNSDSTLSATGAVSLRDETLALVARSRPKDFSPLSLRAPLTVTGSLSSPRVGVRSEALLPKVLAAAALGGLLAPAAAVLPLIDTGGKSGADACTESAPPSSADAAAALRK